MIMATKTNLTTLFLLSFTVSIFGQITPRSLDSTLLPLARSITANVQNDSDKVVAIYQWMFKNLEYDYLSLINEKKGMPDPDSFQQPAIAIRRKKAVCDGYAQIFRDLCLLNGVYSTAIVGYTAFNEMTDSAQILHAWNSVRVNNRWYLMDISWEDAELDFQKNKAFAIPNPSQKKVLSPRENLLRRLYRKRGYRFADKHSEVEKDAEKIATANLSGFIDSTALHTPIVPTETVASPIFSSPAPSYLFVSPQVFRTDHLPKDPLWQLTDSVVSLQKFFFQQDPSVSAYFSTHFDHKKRLEELPNLDSLDQQRRELSRQFQFNPRDWIVVQNIAYDYMNRVHLAFKTFNENAGSESVSVIKLQQILTNTALYLTQAEGFHRMAGKISTGYAAENMVQNLAACEGYRRHIDQLWEWLNSKK
jgi:Transglutaminase-like superfamily